MDIRIAAVRFNNEAVERLLAGETEKGVGLLSQSLLCMRQPTPSVPCNDNETSKVGFNHREQEISTSNNDDSNTNVGYLTNPILSLEDNQFYICNRAISIVEDSERSTKLCDQKLTACIILNLALSYHKLGVLTTKKQAALQRAEKLYAMVEKLLNGMLLDTDGLATLVLLVVVNNMAQIQYDRGNRREACERLKCLGPLLCNLRTMNRSDLLQEDEWNGIIMNYLLTTALCLAPAA